MGKSRSKVQRPQAIITNVDRKYHAKGTEPCTLTLVKTEVSIF